MPRQAGLVVELAVIGLGLGLAGAIPLQGAAAPDAPADPAPAATQAKSADPASVEPVSASPDSTGANSLAPERARLETGSIELDGEQRSFEVYDPALGASPRPVVLALHGTGGDADRLRGLLGGALERVAEERGWLVAYPEAVAGAWNDCRRSAFAPARAAGIDDVAFLRAVLNRLVREHGADPYRVFLFGFSGGGHMAYRVALEDGAFARGIGVFGASLPTADELICADRGEATPLMIVNGGRDLVNPRRGGDVIGPTGTVLGSVRSAEETARYFRDRPGDAEVVLVLLEDGGHTVPGPASRFPRLVGRVERSFDGVGEAATFFARHSAVRDEERQ